jgi:hypothetical protein
MDERFQGTTPNAYEIPLVQLAVGSALEGSPGLESSLGFWALRLPDVHPILEWFAVAVNHLQDFGPPKPDFKPSHEIVVFALDPETYFDPETATFNPNDFSTYRALPPTELEVTFGSGRAWDSFARVSAQQLVTCLVAGELKPFGDELGAWGKQLLQAYRSRQS